MVISRRLLSDICSHLRKQGKKIIFTNGCFDILHVGHVSYLEEASKLGNVLIVGINSDDSVRRLKGPTRPINTEADRCAVISALKSVDFTVVFDEDTPLELIQELTPHVITKGGDYTVNTIVGAEYILSNGGEVVIIPLVDGKSTSSIIRKVNSDSHC
ncbi:MAG: D-glycero-beta-D-manno-heptose 1-phosphate adenylyltransferase [Ignavibacteria bacterium]|nr:D-glycero-beta-D-manno-heptose 1-phosphate adenylyltransferase [Ignavibacteria bacterium]